jgi:hypothetical protein
LYSIAGNIQEDPLTDTIMALILSVTVIVTITASHRKRFMLGIKIEAGSDGRAGNA